MWARMASVSVIALLAALPAACTGRQVYEGLQERNRQQCYKLPQGEMARCLERSDIDYEDYRRQREEIVTGAAHPDSQ